MNLTERLLQEKFVAILRGVSPDQIVSVGKALGEGGIRFIEVTMNSERAAHSIALLREHCPDLYVGAGTVTHLAWMKEAMEAGAQYMISPNVDTAVIEHGVAHEVPVWPGAMTPTEIVNAWEAGARMIKLFPATTLGIDYLKAIKAPLDHIPFMVTGGVNLNNAAEFLKAGASALGLGGQLINLQWIANGEFNKLTEAGVKFVNAVKGQQND